MLTTPIVEVALAGILPDTVLEAMLTVGLVTYPLPAVVTISCTTAVSLLPFVLYSVTACIKF